MTDPNNQPLWNNAINLVIGGCGLLSKRPTRYNSSNWPSYYKSAKGIKIKSLQEIWQGEILRSYREKQLNLDYDSIESCKNCNAHTYQNKKLWAKLQQH